MNLTPRDGIWALPLALVLSAPTPRQQPAPCTYEGTVQAVRVRTGELDLLTGVGHVLRAVHIRVVTTTAITSGNRTVTLAEVQPGDIVRAACHQTDAGLVADRIEKLGHLGAPTSGGATRP